MWSVCTHWPLVPAGRLSRRLHLAEVSRILLWFGHVVLQSTYRAKRRFLTLPAQKRGLNTVGNHGIRDGHDTGLWCEPKVFDKGMDDRTIVKERVSPAYVHKYTVLTEKVNTKTERTSGFLGGDRRSRGWGRRWSREARVFFARPGFAPYRRCCETGRAVLGIGSVCVCCVYT